MSSQSQEYNHSDPDDDYSDDDGPKKKKGAPKKKLIKKDPAQSKPKQSKEPKVPKKPRGPKKADSKGPEDTKPVIGLFKKLDDVMKIEPLKPLNNQDYQALMKCQDAPLYSLNYQTHLAKILSIYDGDTVTAVFYIKGQLKKYKVRICGIDTAEKKDPDPDISELAKHTMEAISPMNGKVVKAQLGKFDKYGRVLSNIYVFTDEGEINVTEWMVNRGIAKPYSGKTKNVYTKADAQALKGKVEGMRLPEVKHYRNPVVQQAV